MLVFLANKIRARTYENNDGWVLKPLPKRAADHGCKAQHKFANKRTSNLHISSLPCLWQDAKVRFLCLFSSPAPKAHWWAYRMGMPPSSVVRGPSPVVCPSSTLFKHLLLRNHCADWSQISYVFSMWWGSESVQTVLVTWPSLPPCPYMVKTLKKSSSPEPTEPKGWRHWNLVCSIGCSSTNKFVHMITLWFNSYLFYGKVKFGPLCFCMGKR